MLHTKFRGNRSSGSGEEDFKGFLLYTWKKKSSNTSSPTPVREVGLRSPCCILEQDTFTC